LGFVCYPAWAAIQQSTAMNMMPAQKFGNFAATLSHTRWHRVILQLMVKCHLVGKMLGQTTLAVNIGEHVEPVAIQQP
jgi:hypothetical protein